MAYSDIGYVSLLVALVMSIYTGIASITGVRFYYAPLLLSARNGVWVISCLLLIASGTLIYGFMTHDFGLRYVALHSSLDMPWYYISSALWGGQEGSLLYWATTLSALAGVATWRNRNRYGQLMPYVIATIMIVIAFFLIVLIFATNPFERLPFSMPDGRGLNPLLRDPGMVIHPPMLLLGYVSWTIPFAFVIAALITGRLGTEWVRAIRRWTLLAWSIQSIGLLLGAWWAYHVLGWGGYWGWDPVENVAFLPWITGTASLHSVMVVERRGKLKVWTISLIILSFLLAIFGTFVVRSGILSSVHSFAESDIGHLFLTFFSLALVGSLILLFFRLPQIKDEEGFESPISRESGFLFNNLLLIGIGFATFWGTIYPIITEAFTGDKITVGPPFFQQVNGPLFFILLLLMGVGPLLAWRQTSISALVKSMWLPLALGFSAIIVSQLVMHKPFVALSIGALAFVTVTILSEYARGLTIRKRNTGENYPLALTRLVSRNKQRYGGYIVHIGILLIAIGIIGSTAFQTNREVNMKKGESIAIGRYVLTYEESFSRVDPEKEILGSILTINRSGNYIGTMVPSTEFYNKFQGQPSSKIAISTTLLDDLYIFQASRPTENDVTLSIFVNPLVMWIWIGGTILILGILIAAWPEKRAVWTSLTQSAKI